MTENANAVVYKNKLPYLILKINTFDSNSWLMDVWHLCI